MFEPLAASLSDVGRVRHNNEDALVCDVERGVFMVCDGMGGHLAGEVASAMACQVIAANIETLAGTRSLYSQYQHRDTLVHLRRGLKAAVAAASEAIHLKSLDNQQQAGMGTTCSVIMLAPPDRILVAHVGDSRIYLLRDGQITRLTCDHTYVGELVARGALTLAEAHNHAKSNVLARAMGVMKEPEIDCYAIDVTPEDCLFLCTDGVHNYLPDDRELNALLASKTPQHSVEALVALALGRGGHDNATGVVIKLVAPPQSHTPQRYCGGTDLERMTLAAQLEVLKRVPAFVGLSPLELMRVLALCDVHDVSPKQSQTGRVSMSLGLNVIFRGVVECYGANGQVATMRVGDALGEQALVSSQPLPASFLATTPARVATLSRDEFVDCVTHDPRLGCRLLGNLVKAALAPAP